MPDDGEPDDAPPGSAVPSTDDVDDTPTVTCRRCDREWDLAFELDELGVGNHAVQQFALDHRRHTGHFPDGIATWRAACRQCPEGSEHLEERAARRWAEVHVRHTRHVVEIDHATDDETSVVESESAP